LAPDASFVESQEGVIYLDENGQPLHDNDWADVVKLNHSNPFVQGYTRANLLWLMKTYGFDGFRLDMAHYPLQDAQKVSSFGRGDSQFWQKVFQDSSLDSADNFWLAEVYDDRTQALYGYADHLALLKRRMIPYDKKTHDIIARKLKYQTGNLFAQDRLYEELYAQAQVLHSIGLDTRQGLVPFLRMPSNHDDCPGVGGVAEYLLASSILALLPGHCVIYAGDEFGLKVKPSVVGINYCDEQGNMTESNQIKLLPDSEQEIINKQIKEILNLRQQEASLQNGAFLMAKVTENTGNLSSSLVAFVRFLPAQNEIILVAANLSSAPSESWGQIKNFYPTFDFPVHEFTWTELLDWINPHFTKAGYKVLNLKSQEMSKLRKFEDEFWIGLQPLEVQVLKIVTP
jgi:glycosidase